MVAIVQRYVGGYAVRCWWLCGKRCGRTSAFSLLPWVILSPSLLESGRVVRCWSDVCGEMLLSTWCILEGQMVFSSLVDPFDLFASDGNLWFGQWRTSKYSNGIMIYSLNSNKIEAMVHTEIKDQEEVLLFEYDEGLLDRCLVLFSIFWGCFQLWQYHF